MSVEFELLIFLNLLVDFIEVEVMCKPLNDLHLFVCPNNPSNPQTNFQPLTLLLLLKMSQSSSKRRGIIPCGSSACSSTSSDGRNPLFDDDDEIEVPFNRQLINRSFRHSYTRPPSPSECQKFKLPETRPVVNGQVSTSDTLFERNGRMSISKPLFGEATNLGIQVRDLIGWRWGVNDGGVELSGLSCWS